MKTIQPSFLKATINFSFLLLLALSFTSCVDTRKALYFPDLTDNSKLPSNVQIPESIIQKNDVLSITVSSLNSEASALFNTPNAGNGSLPSGYLVNSDGYIQYPLLGNIKAEGLTKDQLKTNISRSLVDRKLLVDPIVSIRFVNFRVTVLGEVKNPTVIPVPNEKISLLEALAFAGDMSLYAKRDNVLVIREENGSKLIKRVNLNSNDLFSSPFYYLKSNDIIYVEPNKARVATSGRSAQIIPIVLSGLSLVFIVLDRLIK